MRKWIVFVLLATAPAAPAPADRKAVLDLMRLVIPESSYKAMIDQMTTQLLGQFRQSGAKLPPDAEKRLMDVVLEVIPYQENLGWSADIYQQKFTAEEIDDLRKF